MLKKSILIGAALALSTIAEPITLIAQQDYWQYSVLSTNLDASLATVNYGTVDWDALSWSDGQAAFAEEINSSPLVRHTIWSADQDLALQKMVTIDGTFNGDLTLNLALDNGAIVFVNGNEVFRDVAEGNTEYWEYTHSVSNSFFHQGKNIIQVLAEDHGGNTYFDMRLTGDVTPSSVPEPSMLMLALCGFAVIASSSFFMKKIQ
jgi:hypothetical protein